MIIVMVNIWEPDLQQETLQDITMPLSTSVPTSFSCEKNIENFERSDVWKILARLAGTTNSQESVNSCKFYFLFFA